MIDRVRVFNDQNVESTLQITSEGNGIRIVDVKGLGPVKGQINTSARGQGYGLNYNSTQIGARNIVFSIELSPLYSTDVELLRRQVYLMFPIGELIQMRFESGDDIYQIYGYAESVEPEIFVKNPTLQVSVMCVDPYFRLYPRTNTQVISPSTAGTTINYEGRVDNGVRIEVEILPGGNPSLSGRITIFEQITGKQARGFSIEDFDVLGITGAKVAPGDIINVNTVAGSKTATLKRGSETFNIMPAIKNDRGFFLASHQWPILQVRRNANFRFSGTRYNNTQLKVTLRWEDLIEGL